MSISPYAIHGDDEPEATARRDDDTLLPAEVAAIRKAAQGLPPAGKAWDAAPAW